MHNKKQTYYRKCFKYNVVVKSEIKLLKYQWNFNIKQITLQL